MTQAGPMTLKFAKVLCKLVNGRLPRVGYESKVTTFYRYYDFGFLPGWCQVEVYLQNNAGTYRVWESVSVNPMFKSYRYYPGCTKPL